MHFYSWDEFNENTKDNPPRQLCQEAIVLVKDKNRALDVGAGALNDTKFLLTAGFAVTAIDSNPSLVELAKAVHDTRLTVTSIALEDYYPPEGTFDYINAMFVLPFVGHDTFNNVFNRLYHALAPGGIMAFQLFGDQDEWAQQPREQRFHTNMTFMNKQQVDALLANTNIIKNEETLQDGPLANGDKKVWHQFNIIIKNK